MAECAECGVEIHWNKNFCDDCLDKKAAAREKRQQAEPERESTPASTIGGVVLTTAPSIEGYRVAETKEIITAECAVGMNMFRDFLSGIKDIIGGRSSAIQKELKSLRTTCLNELKQEAISCGANAVIAVDLDYSEFSGGGKSMLFLVASGTAVRIKPTTS